MEDNIFIRTILITAIITFILTIVLKIPFVDWQPQTTISNTAHLSPKPSIFSGEDQRHCQSAFSEEAVGLLADAEQFPIGQIDGVNWSEWTENQQSFAQLVYNSKTDEYLVVWQAYHQGKSSNIFAQRIDSRGQRLNEPITIYEGQYTQAKPLVAYGNGVYLIVWQYFTSDFTGHSGDVHGQLLSNEGELIGSIILIDGRSGKDHKELLTEVIYNSQQNKFLVIWDKSMREGGGSKRNLILWEVTARHITPEGILEPHIRILEGKYEANTRAAYVPSLNRYFLVWQHRYPDGKIDLMGGLLHADYSLDPSTIFNLGINRDVWQYAPNILYESKSNCLFVVWREQERDQNPWVNQTKWNVRGQWITTEGKMDGRQLLIANSREDEQWPQVVQDKNSGVLVIWHQYSDEETETDIYIHSIRPDGALIGSKVQLVTGGSNQQQAMIAKGNNNQYLLIWQSNSTGKNYLNHLVIP